METERLTKEVLEEEKDNFDINADMTEVITVEKTNDETETIDDFFNDVSNIMEKKGRKIDKNVDKYTLFSDAEDDD